MNKEKLLLILQVVFYHIVREIVNNHVILYLILRENEIMAIIECVKFGRKRKFSELQILVIKGMQYFITLWKACFIVHMS